MASAVLGALLALAAGVYVGAQWGARGAARAGDTAPASDDSALAALREENRRLSEQIEQLRTTAQPGRSQSMVPDRTDPERGVRGEWRALANLKRQKIAQPRLKVLGRPGQVHDTFVALFELSPAERESLQRAVDGANERLAQLEAQNATVSRDHKGVVTIRVQPFPSAGGVVYDDLMKTFAATLGEERYSAFVALGAEQVERALANCGAQERTLRISHDPRREKMPYVVRDEFKMGPREHAAETSTFERRDEIPARLGTVARLLPPDFDVHK